MLKATPGLVVLALVVASCSATTSSSTTTTTDPVSTTTNRVTSTTGATVTSTSVTTSTSASPAKWGLEPVITSQTGVMGWWDGESWYQLPDGDSPPIDGDEDFLVADLGNTVRVKADGLGVGCEFYDPAPIAVNLVPQDSLFGSAGSTVAISAPWTPSPRPVELLDDDGTHAAFASEVLAELGYEIEDPAIKQVIRADLDGDGMDEKIVVAEAVDLALQEVSGQYSVVFLRQVVDGSVVTRIIEESVVPPTESGFNASFTVTGIADLGGSGAMEVILAVLAWEFVGNAIYDIADLSAPVLTSGCGV